MSSWNNTGSGAEPNSEVIPILIAARPQTVVGWSAAFQTDARFLACALATDPADLNSKLSYNHPEAILLEAAIFPDPKTLIEFLTKLQLPVYIVLPQADASMKSLEKDLHSIQPVKSIYFGGINCIQVCGRIFSDISTLRLQAPMVRSPLGSQEGAYTGGGYRAICVWNRVGGSGKTTVATALALELAQRGVRTLLIGLSVPDPIPLLLKLKSEPNINLWLTRPNREGLTASIQSLGNLDVLAGLQDVMRESLLAVPLKESESINQLVYTAAQFGGYGCVILDTPPSSVAPNAISASNTLLLVTRPTFADAMASAEAFRIVTRKVGYEHQIAPGNIFTVLNMARSPLLSPGDFQEAASTICRSVGLTTFPPVAAVLPDVPEIPVAQNAGHSPLTASENFSRPIHKLSDMLFGNRTGAESFADSGKSFKIGPIRIRNARG
jgi:MinD-like ATPase involved in chromosome partitioning or flagellar assembly